MQQRSYQRKVLYVSRLRLEHIRKLVGSNRRMDCGGTLTVLVCQGPDVTGRRFEMVQCPVAGESHVAGYLDKPCWDSREKRYQETIERDRQAVSYRFDVRFFSGPAAEKREPSFFGFQGEQFGYFAGRKEAYRNRFRVVQLTKLFHVYPQFTTKCECIGQGNSKMLVLRAIWRTRECAPLAPQQFATVVTVLHPKPWVVRIF